ncbi:MAG: hypothetical protein CVU56_09700 [Deltaproteobacteria bacterium HGW-Deltaproteobacteria-14]|jgi:hypothetical protein|nr:MAG: hypothetical protein CVU56_09700 [Deltaproteobacteria bacterium HGW-Deltaproteobacteria-14]
MRVLTLMLAVTLLAPPAFADVPEWTDEPEFEGFCKELRTSATCADCGCEAITQSDPTEEVGPDGSAFPTALVVKLAGIRNDNDGFIMSQLRAVLGTEGKLADAGVIGDASGHMGNPRQATVEVVGSAQRFDMCPGMCPHEPVGMVHAFEVKTTWTEPTTDEGDVVKTATRTDLALCFAPDDKTPGCWLLPIGEAAGTIKSVEGKPDQVKEAKLWSRSWKLSSSGELELTLGAPTGKGAAAVARASAKLPKKLHLKDLLTRPEFTRAKL